MFYVCIERIVVNSYLASFAFLNKSGHFYLLFYENVIRGFTGVVLVNICKVKEILFDNDK